MNYIKCPICGYTFDMDEHSDCPSCGNPFGDFLDNSEYINGRDDG